MVCMACKYGEMQKAVTTFFSQLNDCYVIIENVPCLKCAQCGEEFITTSVSEKIDNILDSIENIASKIFILDYAASAIKLNHEKSLSLSI